MKITTVLRFLGLLVPAGGVLAQAEPSVRLTAGSVWIFEEGGWTAGADAFAGCRSLRVMEVCAGGSGWIATSRIASRRDARRSTFGIGPTVEARSPGGANALHLFVHESLQCLGESFPSPVTVGAGDPALEPPPFSPEDRCCTASGNAFESEARVSSGSGGR